LSGRVELRTSPAMPPSNSGGYVFSSAINDRLSGVGMYLWSPKPKNTTGVDVYGYVDAAGFSCRETEKTCKVTGKIVLPQLSHSDDMDFENLNL